MIRSRLDIFPYSIVCLRDDVVDIMVKGHFSSVAHTVGTINFVGSGARLNSRVSGNKLTSSEAGTFYLRSGRSSDQRDFPVWLVHALVPQRRIVMGQRS